MFRTIREIVALLRAINLRTYIMAADLSKLSNIAAKLVGDVQTLISIARKTTTNPVEQAAIDAIEASLEGVDAAVSQANADLTPPAPAPAPDPGATGATGAVA